MKHDEAVVAFLDALTELGVPLFHARPGRPEDDEGEVVRPTGWQRSTVVGNSAARARSQASGGALMAATGGAVAVIDVDTKNGADPAAVRTMLDRPVHAPPGPGYRSQPAQMSGTDGGGVATLPCRHGRRDAHSGRPTR